MNGTKRRARKLGDPRAHGWQGLGARIAAIGALGLMLAGCFTDPFSVPPVEPRKVQLPGAAPRLEPGSALEREHKRLIASFGGEYRAPKTQALLNSIADRLRLVSDRPNEYFKITVLNSASVNAFALPNGYVYLTRGLLALSNDTSEIASVIAHEIAHVSARHALARAELESRSALVSRVQSEILENPGAGQFMRDQSRLTLASFSRQQEIDADEMAVRAIARAGFEAHGATRFLIALDRSSRMREALGGRGRDEGNDILSTHPTTPERIQRALAVARQFGAPGVGEADRQKWLQVIEGMTFGDDPSQGLVRGRAFVHPRLKFAIDAPDGFVLENTPQAVLGVTSGAREALRLDSSRVETTRALPALLTQNPIEGIKVGEITETNIGGLPAAIGLARGPEWVFRVVLIRSGENVYRLIYAAQAFTPAIDQRFMESANSFRRLSEDEVKGFPAERIRTIVAKAGDKPEDIVAEQMSGQNQALERFYVLNGLGPGDQLNPGTAYKVVGS
jgi:predicted Zn-dependent protease